MANFRASLAIVLLACAACSDSPTAPSRAQFAVSLRLTGTTFAVGEAVPWNLGVTNTGGTSGQLDFSSGCQSTFRVQGPNGLVWDDIWIMACSAALTRIELAPGETRSFSGTWRQQTLVGAAPPGSYRAQGEFLTLPGLPSNDVSFVIASP